MDDRLLASAGVEFLGSLVAVFAAAGAVLAHGQVAATQAVTWTGLTGIALATGAGYGLAVATTRPLSGGHVNPIVSGAAWLAGRLSTVRVLAYVGAQLAGGVLAAALVASLFPDAALEATRSGATHLAEGTSLLTGLTWEVLLGFIYTLAVASTVLGSRTRRVGALAASGAAFLAVLLGFASTGASFNPARSLGPALVGREFAGQWVYAAGPFLGGALAAGVYEVLLATPDGGSSDAEGSQIEEDSGDS